MSREIKFRAWQKVIGKMIDLKKLTPLALSSHMVDADGLFIPFSDSLILMQYTGLKDRNGKEIYEGDIVRNHRNPHNEELILVRWQEAINDIKWTIEKPGFRFERINGSGTTIWVADKHFEIIGNIYENPELLGGSDT
jgi:uncharacterized phage protein (TIGR01671 family)